MIEPGHVTIWAWVVSLIALGYLVANVVGAVDDRRYARPQDWAWSAAKVAASLAVLAFVWTGAFRDVVAREPAADNPPCQSLQGADLDACLDNEFADDFVEDPREPFGGGTP
jgi:hypothetical protein